MELKKKSKKTLFFMTKEKGVKVNLNKTSKVIPLIIILNINLLRYVYLIGKTS